jgi:hypothetical protein
VATIFDEVLELYSQVAVENRIQVRTSIGPGLDGEVLLDRARVRQLLVNLVDGAVRGSRPGVIHLEATLLQGVDRPLCLRVKVDTPKILSTSDSGDADNQPRYTSSLSQKIIRGLCGLIGGRFEVATEQGGERVMRVFLRAGVVVKGRPGK